MRIRTCAGRSPFKSSLTETEGSWGRVSAGFCRSLGLSAGTSLNRKRGTEEIGMVFELLMRFSVFLLVAVFTGDVFGFVVGGF